MRLFDKMIRRGIALTLVGVLLTTGMNGVSLKEHETDVCANAKDGFMLQENEPVKTEGKNEIGIEQQSGARRKAEMVSDMTDETVLDTSSDVKDETVSNKTSGEEMNSETEVEEEKERYVLEENITFADNAMDNEELFEEYVEELFWGDTGINSYGASTNAARIIFNDEEMELYKGLQEGIAQIASGTVASTRIVVSDLSIDLGTTDSSTASQLLSTLIHEMLLCLLADCPYELYWFDKTAGITCGYSWARSSDNYVIAEVRFSFSVASAYADASVKYMTDTTKTGVAARAAETALSIVTANAGGTDYEKFIAYKNAICDAVSYNSAATSTNVEYGDPWQLIYVFDGDSTTNVVCEGYSKAFQYLCELSTFDAEVNCYTVTGDMGSGNDFGAHMWNHVSSDGENYMVDITNSDAGTVGSDGSLFLAGMSGNMTSGYSKKCTSKTLTYIYDDDSEVLYGTDEDSVLFLSERSYVERNPLQKVSLTAEPTELIWGYESGSTINSNVKLLPDISDELSYQWYEVIESNGIETERMISGATSEVYTIEPNLDAGSYTYRLAVTLGDCVKTADVTINVEPLQLTALDLEFASDTITKIYDGTTDSNAAVQIKAGVVAEHAVEISGTTVYNSANVTDANRVTFTPDAITTGNYRLVNTAVIEHAAHITKADRVEVPDGPQVIEIADTFIELELIEGHEYSLDGEEWQDSNVFTQLSPNTTYLFYQRIKETDNYNASVSSECAEVTTLKESLNDAVLVLDLPAEGYIYDGTEKTPQVEVLLDGAVIDSSQYKVEYTDNIQAGVAMLTIAADEIGEYSGGASVEFTIDKKKIMIDVIAQDKMYDGSVEAQLEVAVETGIDGEILNIQGITGSFEDVAAGADKIVYVDTTDVVITGSDVANYDLIYPDTVLAAIEKVQLKVTSATVADKVYDGTTDAEITELVCSGLVEGESLTVGTDLMIDAVSFVNKNAGKDIEVRVSYHFAGTAILSNYEVSDGVCVTTADISPLEVTPVIVGTHSKVYDGGTECNGEGLSIRLDGVLEGEQIYGAATSFTYADANTGEGKVIIASDIILHGVNTTNYTLSDAEVTAKVGTIVKAPSDIVMENAEAQNPDTSKLPTVNTILTEENSQVTYKVTSSNMNEGTVEYVASLDSNAEKIQIPATITLNNVTYRVTGIAKDAFKNNKKLKKLVIGENVETIGASAFYGCNKLKTVGFGKNVTTIGDKAFYKCTSLTAITIPSKINRIGKKAFYGCKKLKKITIKTKKLSKFKVGKQAFKGIHKKAVITVPKKKLKVYKVMLKARGITGKAEIHS